MCGIVGYIGKREAYPILIKGLHRLEYRGYDSAGIAHTRWATHGEPTQNNAHPHLSQSEDIAIIHNGIIENYAVLKNGLMKEGYRFQSQTDTEVLAQLIEYMKVTNNTDLPTAIQLAMNHVVGAYVIAISQSGETADTLAAVELAKQHGAFIFGICNVVGSSIPRNTHSGCYTHVCREIGVASTKAFTAQVTVLIMLAILIGKEKGTISHEEYLNLIRELSLIPDKVKEVLKKNDEIAELAKIFTYSSNCIYLGRGYNFPVALEGALKLKEISYIHAEGYPAAEMKHGPIALISNEMPVIAIATQSDTYEKVASNIQEIKARKGRIISVVTEGDEVIKHLSDHSIEVPETIPCLAPLLSVIPLQLLAYHIAVIKGCDVDQPRNLAKSVTVE